MLKVVHETTLQLKVHYLVVGAFARDVVLGYGYGISTGEATRDIDLGLMLESWEQFETLRTRLLADTDFGTIKGVPYRLKFRDTRPVDLLPFGPIERTPGEIAWPPEFSTVMSTAGFREASARAVLVTIDKDTEIPFASPTGLALLKLIAWSSRDAAARRKDARDLALLTRKYLEAGNEERLFEEHSELLDEPDFDFELAGARLLGRDVGEILSPELRRRVLDILKADDDSAPGVALAIDMGLGQQAKPLLAAMRHGIEETKSSR